PSLPRTSVAVKPSAVVGTRNAVTPFGPGPPVRANISATPAQDPFVMNILEPEIRHPSPSRSAFVSSDAASDPVPGSVRQKQLSASPEVILGSHSRFCSSVPHL